MKPFSEVAIILILFLVQFIDVLDFMVVMPLGPDFAADLNMPICKLGWIASSYTLAAAFSGIASSTIIDKFERKKALSFTLIGLVLSNIFSANSWNFESLLFSRFLAGIFGGPATSLCFAIVADLFEENRRGAIMGKVMSGFSIAAIFGVPIGLKMSIVFGWAASFYTVAILGVITVILINIYMPTITNHLTALKTSKITYISLFNRSTYLLSFVVACLGSVAAFMIIPYIAPFIQLDLNYPREDLSLVYSVGGVGSFFAMHIAGKFVDKTSSTLITMVSNVFILFTLVLGIIFSVTFIPVPLLFAPFMIGMAVRNVSNYTLYSKVPSLIDRAGFMSIISCIQHLASSVGALATSLIIVEQGDKLKYIDTATLIAIILFLIAPIFLKKIENSLLKEGARTRFHPKDDSAISS